MSLAGPLGALPPFFKPPALQVVVYLFLLLPITTNVAISRQNAPTYQFSNNFLPIVATLC